MSEKSESCCPPPSGKGGNGKYDLAVIGAGSAGFSAAITAAELGAKTSLRPFRNRSLPMVGNMNIFILVFLRNR